MVDIEDFKKALKEWYWSLYENNYTEEKEFRNMLAKYNLTLADIGV